MAISPTSYEPPEEPKLANLSGDSLSSDQEAIPVPECNGEDWFPLIWLDDAQNQRAEEVTREVKKNKDTVIGYNIYADVYGLACVGPVDYIRAVEIDREIVWEGTGKRDGSNPQEFYINIPGRVDLYLKWGTSDQPTDTHFVDRIPTGGASGSTYYNGEYYIPWDQLPYDSPDDLPFDAVGYGVDTQTPGSSHPAYRNQCTAVLKNLFCGFERNSVPSVRLLLDKKPAIWESEPDNVLTHEGINPVFHIAQKLADPIFGLDASHILHESGFKTLAPLIRQSRAINIPGRGSKTVSFGHQAPRIKREIRADAHINDVMSYYDGFMKLVDGKLCPDYFPHPDDEPGGLPILDIAHLAGPISPKPKSRRRSHNKAIVKHRDRDILLNTTGITKRNRAAIKKAGREIPATLDRTNYLTKYQADEYGHRYVQQHALTEYQGKAPTQTSWLEDNAIGLGSLFRLEYSPLTLSFVARVVKIDHSVAGVVDTIHFEQEHGIRANRLTQTAIARPNLVPDPPEAIADSRFYQPAKEWAGNGKAAIIPFVARPQNTIHRASLQYSADDVTYQHIANLTSFALKAKVDIVGDTDDTLLTFTPLTDHDRDAHLLSQTDANQADDTLLALINDELHSLGAITALGGDQYTAEILRARLGTTAQVHAVDDEIWIARRSQLQIIQHGALPQGVASDHFKIQPRTHYSELALEDAPRIDYTFKDLAIAAATNITTESVAGSVRVNFTAPDPDTYKVRYRYTIDDPTRPDAYFDQRIEPGANLIGRFMDPIAVHKLRFWFTLLDFSGNESTESGPIEVDSTIAAQAFSVFAPKTSTPVDWDGSDYNPADYSLSPILLIGGVNKSYAAAATNGKWRYKTINYPDGDENTSLTKPSLGYDAVDSVGAQIIDGVLTYRDLVGNDYDHPFELHFSQNKRGVAGADGEDGENGADGAAGPAVYPRGDYDGAKTYYQSATRRDVVTHGGSTYVVDNPAKTGLATWDEPGVGSDWAAADGDYEFVATILLLAEDALIQKSLTIGAGGKIESENYTLGSAGYQLTDTALNIYDGEIAIGDGVNQSKITSSKLSFGDKIGLQTEGGIPKLFITDQTISGGAWPVSTGNALRLQDDELVMEYLNGIVGNSESVSLTTERLRLVDALNLLQDGLAELAPGVLTLKAANNTGFGSAVLNSSSLALTDDAGLLNIALHDTGSDEYGLTFPNSVKLYSTLTGRTTFSDDLEIEGRLYFNDSNVSLYEGSSNRLKTENDLELGDVFHSNHKIAIGYLSSTDREPRLELWKNSSDRLFSAYAISSTTILKHEGDGDFQIRSEDGGDIEFIVGSGANVRLRLYDDGNVKVSNTLLIGDDTTLRRYAANHLKTDDKFECEELIVGAGVTLKAIWQASITTSALDGLDAEDTHTITTTVTGAAVGDLVLVNIRDTEVNVVADAKVTSADTVTIRSVSTDSGQLYSDGATWTVDLIVFDVT